MTHINGQSITGLQHVHVMKLMIDKHSHYLYVNTIPLEDTSIRKDKRKRLPTLGHRVGKLFRHRSSGSGRIKKKSQSFLSRIRGRDRRGIDSSGHSSSSTPSPKHSASPARSESFKKRVSKMINPTTPRRRPTPVSPLARSTSPVSLAQIITPNSSPPGSQQNLTSGSYTTPPNSPPIYTKRPERHSMITESQLVMHKKSQSACELPTPKHCSPHTSPLLQRAMSPSSEGRGLPARRSTTLPRQHKHKTVSSSELTRSTSHYHPKEAVKLTTTLL